MEVDRGRFTYCTILFFLTVYLSKQNNDNMYKTGRTTITSPIFSKKRRHLEIHKIYEKKKRLLYPVKRFRKKDDI